MIVLTESNLVKLHEKTLEEYLVELIDEYNSFENEQKTEFNLNHLYYLKSQIYQITHDQKNPDHEKLYPYYSQMKQYS